MTQITDDTVLRVLRGQRREETWRGTWGEHKAANDLLIERDFDDEKSLLEEDGFFAYPVDIDGVTHRFEMEVVDEPFTVVVCAMQYVRPDGAELFDVGAFSSTDEAQAWVQKFRVKAVTKLVMAQVEIDKPTFTPEPESAEDPRPKWRPKIVGEMR